MSRAKAVVLALAGFVAITPFLGFQTLSAPVALLGGVALALTLGHPFPAETKRYGRPILNASVILLGLTIDLGTLARAGVDGLALSLGTIVAVFALGGILGRALHVNPLAGLLVSAGTAICGGSAIAAVAGATDAPDEDVAVAAGTVFGLNALALLIFPALGRMLGLSQEAFGRWAGIAIHDVASVAGAGAAFGPRALEVATAVKLSRVLFLVPVVVIATLATRRLPKGATVRTPLPWWIGGFVAASALRPFLPAGEAWTPWVKSLATAGFALALLGIGLGLSRESLAKVGARPLLLGAALWVFVSIVGYFVVR